MNIRDANFPFETGRTGAFAGLSAAVVFDRPE